MNTAAVHRYTFSALGVDRVDYPLAHEQDLGLNCFFWDTMNLVHVGTFETAGSVASVEKAKKEYKVRWNQAAGVNVY